MKIRLNLAIPDGHFSRMLSGTTRYPEHRGYHENTGGYHENTGGIMKTLGVS